MSKNLIQILESKYEEFGTPANDQEAIQFLINAYTEFFGRKATSEVEEGIAEYYILIKNKNLPAYYWLLEAMSVTSKKEEGKRNFPYIVGMLRQWLKWGFGHIPSSEEDDVVEYFEEVTGIVTSLEARKVLQTLMGRYGAIKVTRMIGSLKDTDELSRIYALVLSTIMEEKFGN